MEGAEVLVGKRRKNHAAQEQELREGQNLARGDLRRQLFQCGLQIQQHQAGHAQRGGNPEVPVAHQRADKERRQARHFCRYARRLRLDELVPIRKQQEAGDNQKTDSERQKLRPGKEREGVTDQPDQWKSPHSAKGVMGCTGLVLFTLQPDEKRQEQNQNDLHRIRRQFLIDPHTCDPQCAMFQARLKAYTAARPP